MPRMTLFLVSLLVATPIAIRAENWPQWRGPNLNGVSMERDLPVKWTKEDNVTWKIKLPELSASTPIIWGDRIFLNVAKGDGLYLWCVNRNTSDTFWVRSLGGGNVNMRKHNMSSPSPVTDGKHVYVITGTGSLKGYDFDGNQIWSRDIQKEYGKFGLNHGYASSPLLFEDSLYIQVLHGMTTDEPSYIMRIDKKTGKTLWRVERPTDAIRESPDSYSTPALLRYDEKIEIVITGGDCATGHDPATGKELWRLNGLNPTKNPYGRTIASPVVTESLIYVSGRVRPLVAIRTGGKGNISKSHRVWSTNNGPDVPTPVTDGKYFYVISDKGVTWCLNANTGQIIWGPQRIEVGIYSSSPVLADGKIYVTNEDGITTVMKAGPKFEILAKNNLDDYSLSSVAISEGQLFLRTAHHLYCIGKKKVH